MNIIYEYYYLPAIFCTFWSGTCYTAPLWMFKYRIIVHIRGVTDTNTENE